MTFVVAMALRELRASWRRLLFFFVCISIGVGAIVALRSVIQSVRQVFAGEARTLMGADAVISSNQAVPDDLAGLIDRRIQEAGAQRIRSVEIATMARPAAARPDALSRMVELKAVEDGYPYYGELTLAGGQKYEHRLLADFGVLVRPELLTQLGLSVGDRLYIAAHQFTIRGVVTAEPGRRVGGFSLGPRVFVDLADLHKTGLLTFGSRASFQQLVRVPDARLDDFVATLGADLRNRFVRVRSYRRMEDDIGDDFGRAENYLSLVGLVIVILGGIGVSSVTRVFVQQKIKSIAVLKCVGATSAQLLAIYVAQVLALGVAGSALGVGLAWLAMQAIPLFLAGAAPAGVAIDYRLTVPAVLQGLGIGLLTSLLFSLVPLLDIRHVKPSRLLRDEGATGGRDVVQVAVTAGVVLGLVGLAVWQAGSLRIGLIVAVGFAAVATVLHVAGVLLIRAVAPLSQSPWFALRHAVLQVSRPGSQARLVLLTVGLGTFFILGVRALQENLVSEFSVNMSPDAPDMVLLDVQADQVAGVQALLAESRGPGAPPAALVPVLRARVTGVRGRDVSLDDYEDVRGRGSLAREYTITYRPALERNETVIAGRFWDDAAATEGQVSIEESIRERFGIDVGDTMRFDVLGRTVSATVTSVRHVEWADGRAGGFMFVFRPGLLDKAPHGYVSFFRGPDDPAARARLQSRLAAQFANVSVIDGREMLATIRTVVDNVTLAVTVVGTLVMLSGLLILAGAVAMTKFRRVYEAAIFKTLGATRQVIASVLLLEYGVLGALAGSIGAAGALVLTWAVSRFALDIPWRPLPWLTTAGVVATAVVVAAVGLAASWEVLQKKPLATLRGE